MKGTHYLLGTLLGISVPFNSFAADVSTQWNGGNSGTYAWELAGNWTNGLPDNGSNRYEAIIGDSTGARVITTSGDITVSRIQISQSTATATAGTVLKLGGNLTVNGNSISAFPNASGISNSTGDASKVIIDLGGYDFTVDSTVSYSNFADATNFTLRSTGDAGGVYAVRRIYSSSNRNVRVENNVTVKLTQANQAQFIRGYSFAAQSTLWLAATGTFTSLRSSSTLANFVVGDDNATAGTVAMLAGNVRVDGNTLLSSFSGATGGEASRLALEGMTLQAGGNFTDEGSDGGSYGSGTIVLTGASGTAQTVRIGRQSLTNDFQIGEAVNKVSDVVLAADLSTSGSVHLLENSSLDLESYRLNGGTVRIDSGASLALTFGLGSDGLIEAGDLLLEGFNLSLNYNGSGWLDGSDLLLFTYTGDSEDVNPFLSALSLDGFTYGGLVHDVASKQVYLSDVAAIPEPGAVMLALLGLGGVLAMRSGRRKQLALALALLPGVAGAADESTLATGFEEGRLPAPLSGGRLIVGVGDGEQVRIESGGAERGAVVALQLPEKGEGDRGLVVVADQRDAIHGELSVFSVGMRFKADEAPRTLVFFQRMMGSRRKPGFFAFYNQSNIERSGNMIGTFRFTATGPEGTPETVASKETWTLTPGEWHHVLMTFDHGQVQFFLNGEALGEAQKLSSLEIIPALQRSAKSFRMALGFGGAVDDVVIRLNQKLTHEEIRKHFAEGATAL